MKAKKLLVAMALFFGITSNIAAQNYVYTIIDVYGTRYSDQMMIFTIDGTSHGFDNGWDAPKMFGTYLAPQLFNIEPENYYQINSLDDINNTYIGFKSGEDTTYTMVFTNVLAETKYQQLYLIDSIANKTINIFATGTTYKFSVAKFSDIVKRFKIVTYNPVVVVPPVVPTVTDTTVTPPPSTNGTTTVVPPAADTIVTPPVADNTTTVTPPATDPIVTPPASDNTTTVTPPTTDPVVTPPVTDNTTNVVPPTTKDKDKDKDKKKEKKIKMSCNKNLITVENKTKERAELKLFDAKTGKNAGKYGVAANGKSTVEPKVKAGTYIVTLSTSTENESATIIIQQ